MYKHKHIRTVVSGPFEVQNNATCTCQPRHINLACARHRPTAYAETMARHAADSIR